MSVRPGRRLLKEGVLGTDGKPAWRTAFDDAYTAHKARLLTLATAITGDRNAAEDIMHDVFTKLLKETWRLGNGSSVLPFLVVSTRNGALDQLRRRMRRQAREYEHVERSATRATDPSLGSVHAEEVERILQQVSGLPDDLKETLSLRTWGELTFEEIADLQKVTKSTAHARFNQALEQLRRELSTEDRT